MAGPGAQAARHGRVNLLGISKRGDTYLRTLLIHGARSVLMHAREPGPWLEQIKTRRPANVVAVAQEAKMAPNDLGRDSVAAGLPMGPPQHQAASGLSLVAENINPTIERVCEPLKAIEAATPKVR